MSDSFKRLQSGASVTQFSIAAYNDLLDMLREWKNRGSIGSATLAKAGVSPTVKIFNDSGSARDQYEVLGIDEPHITPTENETEFRAARLTLSGSTPDIASHVGKFAVLAEPIPEDGVGNAWIAGTFPARININSETDTHADIEDGETGYLTSATSGTAVILWKESGTGTKWAVVRIGGGSSGTSETPINNTYTVPCNGCYQIIGSDPGSVAPERYTVTLHEVLYEVVVDTPPELTPALGAVYRDDSVDPVVDFTVEANDRYVGEAILLLSGSDVPSTGVAFPRQSGAGPLTLELDTVTAKPLFGDCESLPPGVGYVAVSQGFHDDPDALVEGNYCQFGTLNDRNIFESATEGATWYLWFLPAHWTLVGTYGAPYYGTYGDPYWNSPDNTAENPASLTFSGPSYANVTSGVLEEGDLITLSGGGASGVDGVYGISGNVNGKSIWADGAGNTIQWWPGAWIISSNSTGSYGITGGYWAYTSDVTVPDGLTLHGYWPDGAYEVTTALQNTYGTYVLQFGHLNFNITGSGASTLYHTWTCWTEDLSDCGDDGVFLILNIGRTYNLDTTLYTYWMEVLLTDEAGYVVSGEQMGPRTGYRPYAWDCTPDVWDDPLVQANIFHAWYKDTGGTVECLELDRYQIALHATRNCGPCDETMDVMPVFVTSPASNGIPADPSATFEPTTVRIELKESLSFESSASAYVLDESDNYINEIVVYDSMLFDGDDPIDVGTRGFATRVYYQGKWWLSQANCGVTV